MKSEKDTSDRVLRVAWWVLFAVMATIAGLIRIRLLGLPIERDKGESAYAGQLMLQLTERTAYLAPAARPAVVPKSRRPRRQQEMAQEIEAAHPKYAVFAAIGTSWLGRPDSEHILIDWFNDYSARVIKPAGYASILSADRTDYYLRYGLESLTPTENYLTIWKRRR